MNFIPLCNFGPFVSGVSFTDIYEWAGYRVSIFKYTYSFYFALDLIVNCFLASELSFETRRKVELFSTYLTGLMS